MTVKTPNMSLPESTINVDSGLTWEQNLNAALTLIDSHNHSPGNGVPIGPSGININASLSFNNNSATNLISAVFSPQVSLATLNAVYVSGANLFYNDGNGNVIQMTSGGLVNATSSGISSGSNSASFVSSVLVVNAASTTPANVQCGSVLLGNNSAGSKYLTLAPPAAMGSNYNLTLPALPGASGNFLTCDTSGNISAVTAVDNSTLQVSTNTLKVKNQGIQQANLAPRTTGSTVAAGGVAISSSSGAFNTSSLSFTPVTNLSVTITTTGRPVWVGLVSDGGGTSPAFLGALWASGTPNPIEADFNIKNGALQIASYALNVGAPSSSTTNRIYVPVSALCTLDTGVNGSPGTYTYTVNALASSGSVSAECWYAQLIAYEI
jgi:hypothetical protein